MHGCGILATEGGKGRMTNNHSPPSHPLIHRTLPYRDNQPPKKGTNRDRENKAHQDRLERPPMNLGKGLRGTGGKVGERQHLKGAAKLTDMMDQVLSRRHRARDAASTA